MRLIARVGKQPVHCGMTVLEVIVVVGILLLLLSLLLPTVTRGRETARKAQCRHNLKQMGVAFQIYHDVHRSFPAGHRSNGSSTGHSAGVDYPDTEQNGPDGFAWGFSILPQLDETTLAGQIQQANGGAVAWTPARLQLISKSIRGMLCPTSFGPIHTFERTSLSGLGHMNLPVSAYVAISGSGRTAMEVNPQRHSGVFGRNSAVAIGSITDGLSSTVVMVEHNPYFHNRTWYAVVPGSTVCEQNSKSTEKSDCWTAEALTVTTGFDFIQDHALRLTRSSSKKEPAGERNFPATSHVQGMHALLADGTVRFLSDSIDHSLWQGLCSRSGGESLGEF